MLDAVCVAPYKVAYKCYLLIYFRFSHEICFGFEALFLLFQCVMSCNGLIGDLVIFFRQAEGAAFFFRAMCAAIDRQCF